jgi:hypothetical protein
VKITNKLGLPQQFVSAVSTREPKPMEISATQLLQGTKSILLQKRHYNEIEIDVADQIWMIFGTAIHSVLERHSEGKNEIKEERLYKMVDDYSVSGQFDLYDAVSKRVIDFKSTSVWKIVYQDYSDWRKQLLIYGWLLKDAGFEVNSGQIIALLKDHSKTKASSDANYPSEPVATINFTFSEQDFAEIEQFVRDKVQDLKEKSKMDDDSIPPCTPAERWQSDTKYAVMKEGRKTAVKLHDTEESARTQLVELGAKHYIQTRPGEDKKCKDYCNCNKFCNYYMAQIREDESA